MSDYCQIGSRSLRISGIVRFETRECFSVIRPEAGKGHYPSPERSSSKEGREAFFEILKVIRSEAREGSIRILRIMIPDLKSCGKGWPANRQEVGSRGNYGACGMNAPTPAFIYFKL
jgi:hypothetical protein